MLSITIIIRENVIGDPSSDPGQNCFILGLCPWEKQESIFSPSRYK